MRAAISLAILIACMAPAQAQTLAQKQMMAKQDEALVDPLRQANEACGTSIKASIDWPGFLSAQIGNNSISGFCESALSTMRGMCSDALAKKEIAAKVQTYTCGFGGAGKRAMSLKDGNLRLDIDWDASNYDDFIKAWLGDHL